MVSIAIATKTTGIGARTSANQKLPVDLTTEMPRKAPSMKKEPCARFTTPIRPNIRLNPADNRKSRVP
jgi:hypothetical protein